MAAVQTLITRCIAICAALAVSEPCPANAGEACIVITALPDRFEYIAPEQDLHPGSKNLYIGGLYEIKPEVVWSHTKGVSARILNHRSIRLIMTHTPAYTRPLLLVVDLSHNLPIAVWWNWGDHRVCIPAQVVADYNLDMQIKRGRLQANGDLCLRP